MAKLVRSPENLHTLYHSSHPLGVICTKAGCGHRSTISAAHLGASDESMRELRSLKFRCTRCGSREHVAMYLFGSQTEVERFLYGDDGQETG